ncbi:CyP450 monooxygenase [Cubamyces sp. BRFM 1775]|nr:CyP450 monooxygenase [Cubamyces sp. BRFM 1775]
MPTTQDLSSASLLLAFLILLVIYLRKRWTDTTPKGPLPPGPPGLPILGNLLDVPTANVEEKYRELNDKFGDVVYLNALGQPMLVLGTHNAAVDLLEKRSAVYSDRAYSPMVDLGGFDWVLTLLRYGLRWRRHRRMFHQFFNPNVVTQYRPVQRAGVAQFLSRLLSTPDELREHIRNLFAATIVRITYGFDIKEKDDDYVQMAEKGIAAFSSLLVPGKYLVELFPALRHLPAWFPGCGFKREAIDARVIVQGVRCVPWARTITALREGSYRASMASALLERISALTGEEAIDEEDIARNTVAVAYAAGADTTLASIQAFFLAMALFPEAQRKAQAELDAVVGSHRLPDFSDESALPFVCALVKECLRWHAVLPLAVPHRLIEDDTYRGYHIPKGTVVVPNVWAFSRDETRYVNAKDFKPERFLAKDGSLDPQVLDPSEYAFGYGRRICPGRHFAQSSLFLIVASVLHTFSISAPLDENGAPKKLEAKMTSGLIS